MTFLLRASNSSLRRAVAGICASVFTVFSLAPLAALAAPTPKKRVTKGAVLLRTGPSKGHAARALLTEGRPLRVVKSNGQWVRVRLATGTEGWVRRDLLTKPVAAKPTAKKNKKTQTASAKKKSNLTAAVRKPVSAAAKAVASRKTVKAVAAAPKPQPKKTAKSAAASVRRTVGRTFSRRSTVASVRTTVAQETATERTGTITIPVTAPEPVQAAPSTEWIQLARVDAPEKAPAKATAINRTLKRGESIVRRALSYRGSPYRRGASGRGAFDCSGFTSYLYRKAGSPLPRTAASQFHVGKPIAKGDLQPGDLVFFKNTYKRGVSHVGVYAGNGNFVHASGSGRGVRVDSLHKPYYVNHWAGARRLR